MFSRLNQLGRHAHAITAAAHAAFEQITNSEFLTNLGNVFFCTFVSHDGGSGDYPKLGGLELAELGDHLLRQTIGKIIFARITAQIRKGEHCKHGSLTGRSQRPESPRH